MDYSERQDILEALIVGDVCRAMMVFEALAEDDDALKVVCDALAVDEDAFESVLSALKKHPDSFEGMCSSLRIDIHHLEVEMLRAELDRWTDEQPEWMDD